MKVQQGLQNGFSNGTSLRGLYLVTPDEDDTEILLATTEQALREGVALLQYRHKLASENLRQEQATALLHLCRRYRVPLIINDHLDLFQMLDADGMHVGATDAAVATIRSAIGIDKILGASCYGTLSLAQQAYQDGASYVAFGGFFPSRVKKYPVTTDIGIIAQSKSFIPLPVVVIGGMTPENCSSLIAQGADMVAAISSVYSAVNVSLAVRSFGKLFQGKSE